MRIGKCFDEVGNPQPLEITGIEPYHHLGKLVNDLVNPLFFRGKVKKHFLFHNKEKPATP